MESKKEVEEDVKFNQVCSVSDVDKGDLMEQLVAKNKLLLDMISQLKEQIAEKVNEIDERNNQIAEKDQEIAEQAKQIAEKDEQTVKYQQMYEGLMQG